MKENIGKLRQRQREPWPWMGNDQVLTMEIIDEFSGIDQDKQTYHGFLSLPHFDMTTTEPDYQVPCGDESD